MPGVTVALMNRPRLRLLKVICQPVFVIDDGEVLIEQTAEPVTVSAADWPTYATVGFLQAVSRLEQMLEEATRQENAVDTTV